MDTDEFSDMANAIIIQAVRSIWAAFRPNPQDEEDLCSLKKPKE